MSRESGQATVELVALLPALSLVVLGAAALLAGHGAHEQAGTAAQAGAMAMLQGGDPRESARRALPAQVREDAAIDVRGRRVTVRVQPRLPLVARAMTAEVTADAGPEVSP
jgi:Flp pilus assembly protein TadG